jgi:hypothetical protein
MTYQPKRKSPIDRQYHIEFGIHSGIPSCCIEFFVDEWDAKRLWRQDDLPLVREIHESGAQYVQCPKCLMNNCVVDLHFCDSNCEWGAR